MAEFLRSFEAYGKDGTTHQVDAYQEFLDVTTPGELIGRQIPGVIRLLARGGGALSRLGKGLYRVAATGEVLRSDDPGAP